MKTKTISPKPSKKKTTEVFQIQVTPANLLKINPSGKYLLIFHRTNYDKGDLSILDKALQEFFKPAQVMAIFADQVTDVKIAELLKGGK
jgi:hypothetical protein